jgi:arylsulfatase A-like enzyme
MSASPRKYGSHPTAPFLLAIAWLGLLIWGCSKGVEDRGPINVILLTLDTTRADRLGCYGNQRIATPYLDRLAAEGARFDAAFTPVPSTLPSHSSIMTGTYPAFHGVHDNGVYRLGAQMTTLAERFSEAGYSTGAFVSAWVLNRNFGLGQGFQVYDDEMDEPLLEGDRETLERASEMPEETRKWLLRQTGAYQRRADAVAGRAIRWLGELDHQPFFLWVHFFDPHMSYQPPSPWDKRYDPDYSGQLDGTMRSFLQLSRAHAGFPPGPVPAVDFEHMVALYDGEVSFMDEWIGRLLQVVRAVPDRWQETLVVVVGDHGEGFGEHGQFWEHNGQIFDEVMRVPLIVKRPSGRAIDPVVARLVGTIDIAPTILEEASLSLPNDMQGESLFGKVPSGGDSPGRMLLLEALRERQAVETPYSWLGLRGDRYKLILHLEEGLEVLKGGFYDLTADPAEQLSRHAQQMETMDLWTRRTLLLYSEMSTAGNAGVTSELDSKTRRALEALGYVD